MTRRTNMLGLVAVVVLVCAPSATVEAQQGDIVRYRTPEPLITKPITIHADEAAAWEEEGRQIILLHGTVLLEQGVTVLRSRRAVARVVVDDSRRSRLSSLQVYLEGEVRGEVSAAPVRHDAVLLDLTSYGEVRVTTKQPTVQQAFPQNDLYRRAVRSMGVGPAVPADTTPRSPAPRMLPESVRREVPGTNAGSFVRTGGQAPPLEPPPGANPPPLPPSDPVPPAAPGPIGGPPPLPPPNNGATTPLQPKLEPFFPEQPAPTPQPKADPAPPAPPRPSPTLQNRTLTLAQRYSAPFELKLFPIDEATKEQAALVYGGIILTVKETRSDGTRQTIDIEADRLVMWTRGDSQELVRGMSSREGETAKQDREYEFYLSGNVVIRSGDDRDQKTMLADEVYFDVNAKKAIAINADLAFETPAIAEVLRVRACELWQLSNDEFQANDAEVAASRLPSDPKLKLNIKKAYVEARPIESPPWLARILGLEDEQPTKQRWFTGENAVIRVVGIPLFYTPFIQGDVNDPLGPLQSFSFGNDNIFGTQLYTNWSIYELLGLRQPKGRNWLLNLDYLSFRGPGVGTIYDYRDNNPITAANHYTGYFSAYGIYDRGVDIMGGAFRQSVYDRPTTRGRAIWRHQQTFDEEWSLQGQFVFLSDWQFYEQYYKIEFDQGPNQETFLQPKWQRGNLSATGLLEVPLREWVVETGWLPKFSGYALGIPIMDLLSYNAWGSVGYASLVTNRDDAGRNPLSNGPPPITPTDIDTRTGRFNLMQELSAPFMLGSLNLVPYGKLDLTQYTDDLTGNPRGRFYGGGGLKASLPLSRIYPDISSEFLNLKGINHKVTFGANYYAAYTDTPYTRLPQLDRLNDDTFDQTLRGYTPFQPALIPGPAGQLLATSPLFDPQRYAIRRLNDYRTDTLDTIEIVQLEIRQRWQTKRGAPGAERTIDWMTLDLSGSFFPDPDRDNFGESAAFLEYHWQWFVGDRTNFNASGWVDPFDFGARQYLFGFGTGREDGWAFFANYRVTEPIQSRMMAGGVTYAFSPKYIMSANVAYDFGTNESLSQSLLLSRVGTDVTISIGFTYNSLVNNFGVQFAIIPNVLGARNVYRSGAFGQPGFRSR